MNADQVIPFSWVITELILPPVVVISGLLVGFGLMLGFDTVWEILSSGY